MTSKMVAALALVVPLGGCVAASVASSAVSVAATAVETTVDVAGAAVDLALPDDD